MQHRRRLSSSAEANLAYNHAVVLFFRALSMPQCGNTGQHIRENKPAQLHDSYHTTPYISKNEICQIPTIFCPWNQPRYILAYVKTALSIYLQ